MNYALDAIIVIIFLTSILTSMRKGFARSVLEIASFVVAYFIAKTYTPELSGFISENYIIKGIESFFKNSASAGNDALKNSLDSMAEFFEGIKNTDVMKSILNIKPDELGESFSVESVFSGVIGSISDSISSILAFILLFLGALIVLRLVIKILDIVFKLPGIGGVNSFFGLLLGAAKGWVLTLIFCMIVSFLVATGMESAGPMISVDTISQTYVFKYFYDNNFISNMLL